MQNSTEPVVALVVAAGSGSRLGGTVPKALVEVGGRALVRWSVEAMAAGGAQRAVVVVAEGLRERFVEALDGSPVPVDLVTGGARRQDSVANGLAYCGHAGVVLVHDAARPFVPEPVVRAVVAAVGAGHPCVIPVVPVVDTIRQRTGEGLSQVVDRSALVAVQTPQGFDLDALRRAHREASLRGLEVTDDAAVCEALGMPVHLVGGSRESTKVTEPFDVLLAEAIAASRTTTNTPTAPH